MSETLLISILGIVLIGIASQWISWRFKLPSIFLLLVGGIAAGPLTGFLDPDALMGELLFPFISLSVAVILFEGGMNLRLKELENAGSTIRNLIIIGVPVTWVLTTIAAYYILGISFQYSVLLGAILVVTGPTVVMPLLRFIKPKGKINSIIKWEGIINDPTGALLAILVFEVIVTTNNVEEAFSVAAISVLKTIFFSGIVGLAAAYILTFIMRKNYLPDFLHTPASLSAAITIFILSNLIQKESGLFAVTIMGIYMANQNKVSVKHIREFKENLRVLLITFLFIILAARLTMDNILLIDFAGIVFVLVLMFVIRPLMVFLSTIGNGMTWKEKFFISWMGPRGIVAAAVSSLFALELSHLGFPNTDYLVSITFLVIIMTIVIYGLGALPLSKLLGVSSPNSQGALIVGAHPLARDIGRILKENEISTVLVDTNRSNIKKAQSEGFRTYYGSAVSKNAIDDINLDGIGKMFAMTPNKEVNSLAVVFYQGIFGSDKVFQFGVEGEGVKGKEVDDVSHELRGKLLFDKDLSYHDIIRMYNERYILKSTNITEEFSYEDLKKMYDESEIIPFFLIDKDKNLVVYTSENKPEPEPGYKFIGLVKEKEEKKN